MTYEVEAPRQRLTDEARDISKNTTAAPYPHRPSRRKISKQLQRQIFDSLNRLYDRFGVTEPAIAALFGVTLHEFYAALMRHSPPSDHLRVRLVALARPIVVRVEPLV